MPVPKVSVIIPVYNVEQYIERCARSLFEQTLDDIEFIFIDDCSSDDSIKVLKLILEEYPSRRSQAKIIVHKVNVGVSQSRQEGVNVANGEYIIHCDPDDWIDQNMYELMYHHAQTNCADVVICNIIVEDESKQWIRKNNIAVDCIDCAKKMLLDEIHCATWNKLIKANLYKNKSISFPKDINLWEDFCTIIPMILNSKKILFIDNAFYHYRRINPFSYTLNISKIRVFDIIHAICRVQKYFEEHDIDLQKALLNRKLKTKLNLLINTEGDTQESVSSIFPEIKKGIWESNISPYWKVALYTNELFGIRGFMFFSKLKNLIKRK